MTRNWSARISAMVVGCGLLLSLTPLFGQVAGTGAISGVVSDPSGAVIPGATVTARNLATGEERHTASSAHGDYNFQLLAPGRYQVMVSKEGFSTATVTGVTVSVTETATANAKLTIGQAQQTVEVQAAGQLLQTESSTLGQVVTSQMVEDLPLVTRNYTQIIDLSPGVAADVTNAGELGRGGQSEGLDAVVAAGTTSGDNNFQMDGVDIDDLQGSGNFSGGVAVPNPDTIQEFRVQTSQYDASYGRDAGANVNVVTKTGGNNFHGSIWEFFRNEDMNANGYFQKQEGQPRPVLRQNQPGFTLGGPIKRDKAFFFVSYQSTRQENGVDTNCSTTFNTPPLTNDRSAAALGALFAGQPTFTQELGLPGGATVAPDGSNISPQALALFNLKLPNGQYVIPTPQVVDPSLPFAGEGVTSLSSPCVFNEDQFMTNGDWNQSVSNQWQARFFFANSEQLQSFPYTNLGGATSPGFPQEAPNHFRNVSLINNHIFRPNLLNQAEFGFHRVWAYTDQRDAFAYSDIGAAVPSFDNTLPEIEVLGGPTLGGNGQDILLAQNTYVYQDTVSWTRGGHALRFGGGVTRAQDNLASFRYLGGLIFGTYPDLLLGESAAENGTPFSNIYGSVDVPGLLGREFRQLDVDGYAQDDWKATPNLTFNLGFRFERVGGISDALGRTGNFDLGLADPNPPATGSLDGFVVASNFKGTLPAGVTRSPSKLGIEGQGQNTLNPRLGFAWSSSNPERLVVRGGFGVYHTTPSGQPNLQLLTNPPFGEIRETVGAANGGADFANPITPLSGTFPQFVPYSPSSSLGLTTFAQSFRPAVVQHYDLTTQVKLSSGSVLEVGYLGTRGQNLILDVEPNQAALATPSSPIRGQTNNTVTNVPLRVPVEGLSTSAFGQIDSTGYSRYNALLANFTQRFHDGSQYQIAYTWSRYLSDAVTASTGPNGGIVLGNQKKPDSDYGPDLFNRPQRLIANFVYAIPTPFRATSLAGETLGGWHATGVVTLQEGHFLYASSTNAFNAYGINGQEQDFAEVQGCTNAQVRTPGSVTHKLNDYFKATCFAPYPVIGADGLATGFGNTRPGITRGPAQNNADLALIKTFPVSLHHETGNVEFRAEAFNALNTPQFSDPVLYADAPNFGVINTTAVAPRILQLAVKLGF